MSLSAGTRLGPYEITSQLGAGGMVKYIERTMRDSTARWLSMCCPHPSPMTGITCICRRSKSEGKTLITAPTSSASGRFSKTQVLCDAARFTSGAWNKNGVIVFGPDYGKPLFQVPATGGEPQPVTVLNEGENIHRHPNFLPDGKHFLYSANAKVFGSAPSIRLK